MLLGIRAASRGADLLRAAMLPRCLPRPSLPRLSVAMLQPNRVLREVLSSALVRLARDGNGWDLQLDAVATVDAFLAAMASRRRNLAIVDCDGIGAAADAARRRGPLARRVRAAAARPALAHAAPAGSRTATRSRSRSRSG